MKRIDFFALLALIIIILIIFYPIFYAEYLYTDEATQIWFSAKKLNYQTSIPQGRYITYLIFEWLFTFINTTHDIIYARLFSLFGWIVCLPFWYFIINKTILKNQLPKVLVFVSMVYLICMPPFAIYVGWAACMQMFVACTSGLVAGYILYEGIKVQNNVTHISTNVIVLSVALGNISLFTYQNGFGCFLIPFFIHFIAAKKITKTIYLGIAFTLFIYLIYFLLYKYSISLHAVAISERSSLTTNPINKLLYFIGRPLANAFHFTFLFNEKSIGGFIAYIFIAALWLTLHLVKQKLKTLQNQLIYLAGLLSFFIIIYLPSLLVKENFSSHRTMFALDMVVFIMVMETIFTTIKNSKATYILATSISILMVINAWYIFNNQFLNPLTKEYSEIKQLVNNSYDSSIHMIQYIPSKENAFEKKYGIIQSWDEFGVPSTAKIWTGEPLIKQLIFEKTNNRAIAENTTVKNWVSKDVFNLSKDTITKKVLLINMDNMSTDKQ